MESGGLGVGSGKWGVGSRLWIVGWGWGVEFGDSGVGSDDRQINKRMTL